MLFYFDIGLRIYGLDYNPVFRALLFYNKKQIYTKVFINLFSVDSSLAGTLQVASPQSNKDCITHLM